MRMYGFVSASFSFVTIVVADGTTQFLKRSNLLFKNTHLRNTVIMQCTLRASLSGTLKDVVNQCLEFAYSSWTLCRFYSLISTQSFSEGL